MVDEKRIQKKSQVASEKTDVDQRVFTPQYQLAGLNPGRWSPEPAGKQTQPATTVKKCAKSSKTP